MDEFIRKLLGFSPRIATSPGGIGPHQDNSDQDESRSDYFTHPYNHDSPTNWPPDAGFPNDDFQSIFKQMEKNFEAMSRMIDIFHGSINAGHYESSPKRDDIHDNPRNALLKQSDTPGTSERAKIQPFIPPGSGGSRWDEKEDNSELDVFGGGATFFDPFVMMDDMIRNFSGITLAPDIFESPFSEPGPVEEQDTPLGGRDYLLKQDADLDDRGSLANLPSDGPGYSYSPQQSPESSMQRPGGHTSFHSSSIVRIVKPDGTIEETRKYRDSSGREEVTVTQIDPKQDGLFPGDTRMPGQCVIS